MPLGALQLITVEREQVIVPNSPFVSHLVPSRMIVAIENRKLALVDKLSQQL